MTSGGRHGGSTTPPKDAWHRHPLLSGFVGAAVGAIATVGGAWVADAQGAITINIDGETATSPNAPPMSTPAPTDDAMATETPPTATPPTATPPASSPSESVDPEDVIRGDSRVMVDTPPFTVNGERYSSGIGLPLIDGSSYPGDWHDIEVPSGYSRLVATVGMADDGDVDANFHVTISRPTTEEVLWEDDIALEQTRQIDVDITGATRIRLFGTGLDRTYSNDRGTVVLSGEFLP